MCIFMTKKRKERRQEGDWGGGRVKEKTRGRTTLNQDVSDGFELLMSRRTGHSLFTATEHALEHCVVF